MSSAEAGGSLGLNRWSGRVPVWQPSTGHHASKLVLTCHDRLPLSSPVSGLAWRFMAKLLSGSGFAVAAVARRCSGSVGTVIAGSVTVVPPAVTKPGCGRGAVPTAATNEVRKAGWIIATANARIGTARRERA